ncbi:MAG: hypothetical protein PHS49_02995 [Candidatus Gracilibacteria bacterium]|nr:hypothetical protein [Candidatus Gracilibacteria bacterium]
MFTKKRTNLKKTKTNKRQLQKIYGRNYRKFLERKKFRKLKNAFNVVFILITDSEESKNV